MNTKNALGIDSGLHVSAEQILMHFDDDKIADPGTSIRAGDIIIQPRERERLIIDPSLRHE